MRAWRKKTIHSSELLHVQSYTTALGKPFEGYSPKLFASIERASFAFAATQPLFLSLFLILEQ
jgi:hypothetical protein